MAVSGNHEWSRSMSVRYSCVDVYICIYLKQLGWLQVHDFKYLSPGGRLSSHLDFTKNKELKVNPYKSNTFLLVTIMAAQSLRKNPPAFHPAADHHVPPSAHRDWKWSCIQLE